MTLTNCSNHPTATDNNNNASSDSTTMLKEELMAKKKAFLEKADTVKITAYEQGILDVEATGILNSALNIGDTAPNFTLKNAQEKEVQLYNLLKTGPVILTWYRGGWCPYCNITLRYLQNSLPQFKEYNAQLVALSPEVPDKSLSTKEKHELQFEVLSDLDNKVGFAYGVVYTLPDEIAKRYENGFGLSTYNGNNQNQLPLAATYVIDQNKVIQYAYLNADYRERAEPKDIIATLKELE